eukprot:6306929-Pyramimonas_sp.AAC.1
MPRKTGPFPGELVHSPVAPGSGLPCGHFVKIANIPNGVVLGRSDFFCRFTNNHQIPPESHRGM